MALKLLTKPTQFNRFGGHMVPRPMHFFVALFEKVSKQTEPSERGSIYAGTGKRYVYRYARAAYGQSGDGNRQQVWLLAYTLPTLVVPPLAEQRRDWRATPDDDEHYVYATAL